MRFIHCYIHKRKMLIETLAHGLIINNSQIVRCCLSMYILTYYQPVRWKHRLSLNRFKDREAQYRFFSAIAATSLRNWDGYRYMPIIISFHSNEYGFLVFSLERWAVFTQRLLRNFYRLSKVFPTRLPKYCSTKFSRDATGRQLWCSTFLKTIYVL